MKNSQKNSNRKNKILDFIQNVEERANDTLEDTLMDDDAKNEGSVVYDGIVKNSMQARMSKLPWLIAIFLILMISITFGLMFLGRNPKTLFTQTIDGMFSYLESNINDNVYDITDGNIIFDYDVLTNLETDVLKNEFSHIKWNADYVKDNSKGAFYLDLKTKYDDSDLLKLKVYGDNSDTYIYASDLYDKYVKFKNNKINYLFNSNDAKIILDGFNQAIDKVIADEKIYSNKELLNVDGKDLKTVKTRFLIDDKNGDRVCETFINSLKSNDEFVSSFSRLKNVKGSNVKKSLDKYLIKLKRKLKEYGKLNVVLYTDSKTSDFVKFALSGDNEIFSLTRGGNDNFYYEINDENKINGEFSLDVNENKTKYVFYLIYKKSIDNNVVFEDRYNLKFTCKKTNYFKKVDFSDSVDGDKLDDLTKTQIYMNIASNSNLSRIISEIKLARS